MATERAAAHPGRIDLVTLALFDAVARAGSISAGARQVHLAVGAASKRIADLEDALGTPLLYRSASGVLLTDAGQACLGHAQRVLREVAHLRGSMVDYQQGIRGTVRLRANTSAITQFLADDIAGFMAAHTAVRIQLQEQDSGQIVRAVLENQADLGIFADGTPCEGLQTFAYREDELVVVAPSGHPLAEAGEIAFADTLGYDFVGLSSGTSLAQRLEAACAGLGHEMRLRIQVRGFDSICRMAVSTGCIGILPRLAAEPHARSMRLALIPLSDAWSQRELRIGARDVAALDAAGKSLLGHLRASAARTG